MTISNFERAQTHTFPSGNERASSGLKFDTTLFLKRDLKLQVKKKILKRSGNQVRFFANVTASATDATQLFPSWVFFSETFS